MTANGIRKLMQYQKSYFGAEWKRSIGDSDETAIAEAWMESFKGFDDDTVLSSYQSALVNKKWDRMPSVPQILSILESERGVYRCCDCGMKWGRAPEIKEPGKYYCRMCGAEVSESDDPFDAIPRGIARQYQPSRKMSLEQYVEKYPFSSLAKKAGKLGDLKKFGRFDGDPVEVSLADADYWIGKDKRIGQMWEAIKFSCRFKVVAGGETDDDAYDRMARFMEYYVPGWKRPVPVSGYYLAEQIEF